MSDFLQQTEAYLQTSVASIANEIDTSPDLLQQAFQGLGNLGVLGLRVPQQWGGKQVSAEDFAQFQELIARYSGALAFLQTQHQSAAGMLMQSSNSALQDAYLPDMSYGKITVGVGFSQLRRSGKPTIIAKEVSGGYELNGNVPWVTGWTIFQEFIIAATLPDGRAVFGLVPLENLNTSPGEIKLSSPMSLCAMTSTNTVSASLTQWFLPSEKVVSIKPAGWITENDDKNALKASFFALGCARAGLDILETAFDKKGFTFIQETVNILMEELNQCRTKIQQAQENPSLSLAEKYQLRAWAINLAVRCSHGAVIASSGAANLSQHHAQRVYREALVYSISGQTKGLMEASLNTVIQPKF
ncbi:acyl-CoA dehydrogenase family protein [Limnoraphis robusta]|uniref:acyl-CoA dehydrogenase family protein n=1 Tax=Limnoraphis robusta TaxID=1118279 RepID=UPI002B1FC439|nr:acyl-CoA dehydrogenase family protein [Limnoraphis robusta]MEA5496097.1 acyl-CoA dehydrogenase family protein [Limnoraphis robusta BA-68 BA1]